MKFSHLHNHTQYSLLDGHSNIKKMFERAKEDNMPAIAITDHGNMFGVFDFVATAGKYGVKPIIGCEFYLVDDHTRKSFTKNDRDVRYHQLLIAKDEIGYKNLSKLCSLGYIEGLYGKYPRVSKELIEKYSEGLIATSCCLAAIIPKMIIQKGEKAAETEFKWWLDRFGEDYYVELQRHDIPEQNIVNEVLLKFAKKYNVKTIATNDTHYVEREDWEAHDILLCLNTGEKLSTPANRGFSDDEDAKGMRFAFANDQFYLKSTQEMIDLFSDIPEAIDNTNEIVDKVESLNLYKDIMLPNFQIPQKYHIHQDENMNQWEYLKDLTFEGAKIRYGEITEEVEARLNSELFTIQTMGFAGYFLIVMDFIREGRNLGVMIGPGRGSAAGSAVAYCIGITNVDPIKYNLLFERFLNPDRKSMPDIDTDFDDEGRQKVIDYVVDKYGKNQVAQIITYGTMATKMAIKDVARVMELPLAEANYIAKLVPDKPSYGINFNKLIHYPLAGDKSLADLGMMPDEIENVKAIRDMYEGNDLTAKVLQEAEKLEGTVRNTGVHAAGIIIAPEELYNILPVATSRDSDMLLTQYEGRVIEDAGVIKMDFLGLRNLTILKETLRMIDENYGVQIDLDNLPLDDAKTFELFQRGETNGIFQFESDGMKKHMRDLKPDRFDDLIALNALYRPGPIKYIPNYVARKQGREEIVYDLPEMEEFLKETYGITVYQEQVMLLSQKLGNFSGGQADDLRKAMGKKQKEVLDEMQEMFFEGGTSNGYPIKKLEKIWRDWEAFAQYAFNKSHSTCYALIAYQTAYLKTHYPEEYMAGVLTSYLGNIDKITFFMEECKSLGLLVLGPDINESQNKFSVNKKHEIRFGLGGIKGTGAAAVSEIIQERNANGPFKDIFDFVTRVNLRTVNKKTIESLAYAGAFDSFEDIHRSVYFNEISGEGSFIERLTRYGTKVAEDKINSQNTLFGDLSDNEEFRIAPPKIDRVEKWGNIEKLKYEKEVVGFYISGHPLDQFSLEMSLCEPLNNTFLSEENNGRQFTIGGIVTFADIRTSQKGTKYGRFKIEDYTGSLEIPLFSRDFIEFNQWFVPETFIYIKGFVGTRYNRPDEYEFKVKEVGTLNTLLKDRYSKVKVKIDISELNQSFIADLDTILRKHPGSFSVDIDLIDNDNKFLVNTFSRTLKVDLNKEFHSSMVKLCGAENISLN